MLFLAIPSSSSFLGRKRRRRQKTSILSSLTVLILLLVSSTGHALSAEVSLGQPSLKKGNQGTLDAGTTGSIKDVDPIHHDDRIPESTSVDPVDQDVGIFVASGNENDLDPVTAAALRGHKGAAEHRPRSRREAAVAKDASQECPGDCRIGRCFDDDVEEGSSSSSCLCPLVRPGPHHCGGIEGPILEARFDLKSKVTYPMTMKIRNLHLKLTFKLPGGEPADDLPSTSVPRNSSEEISEKGSIIMEFLQDDQRILHLELKDKHVAFRLNGIYRIYNLRSINISSIEQNWNTLEIQSNNKGSNMKLNGEVVSELDGAFDNAGAVTGTVVLGGFEGCIREVTLMGKKLLEMAPSSSSRISHCDEDLSSPASTHTTHLTSPAPSKCLPNPCGSEEYCLEDETSAEGFSCNCNDVNGPCPNNDNDRPSVTAFCPAETRTILNTQWALDVTEVGESFVAACPLNQEVTFAWRCLNDNQWEEYPDLSHCNNDQLFLPPVDDGSPPAHPLRNITVLGENIQNQTKSVPLMPGALLEITEGLTYLQNALEENVRHDPHNATLITEKYLQAVVSITDKTLVKPETWRLMPRNESHAASTHLQENVVNAALLKEKFSDFGTTNYSSDTVNVRVIKQEASYFDDPRNLHYELPNENYTHQGQDNETSAEIRTYIRLPRIIFGDSPDSGGVSGNTQVVQKPGVIYNGYNELHCSLNTIPCDPKKGKQTYKSQINSAVIGAALHSGKGTSVSKTLEKDYIEVKLLHIYDGISYDLEEPQCVWWSSVTHDWDSSGCELNFTDPYYSLCHCYHLTNFAVLMDIGGVLGNNEKLVRALEWITIIGCSISIVFLFIGFVSFLLLKGERRKQKSSVGVRKFLSRVHLCLCLAIAYLIILCGLYRTENKIVCASIAATLQFFLLAAFTWSAIEAFNLYLAFHQVFEKHISEKIYTALGYGFPALFVGLNLASTQAKGYGTPEVCWLERSTILWGFLGYLAFIMIVNFTAYVMALRKIYGKRSVEATMRKNEKPTVRKVLGSAGFFIILGLTWITGFSYFTEGAEFMAVTFSVLNSFQGALLVILEIFCEPKVKMELLVILHIKSQDKRVPLPPAIRHSICRSLRLASGKNNVEEFTRRTQDNTIQSNMTSVSETRSS